MDNWGQSKINHSVAWYRASYQPQHYIDQDEDLQNVINLLKSGHFNAYEPRIFDGLIESLLKPHDPWMTLADFRSYIMHKNKSQKAGKIRKNGYA